MTCCHSGGAGRVGRRGDADYVDDDDGQGPNDVCVLVLVRVSAAGTESV